MSSHLLMPPPANAPTLGPSARQNCKVPMVICDPDEIAKFKSQRAAIGSDKYDEVWDGVIVVMSLPNDEQQAIVTNLSIAIHLALGFPGPHHVRVGINVSNLQEDWKSNYRCPDVVAYLDSTKAINCGSHWCGGPDFLVEIVSPGDPTREKLPFYAAVASREVLIVDRNPWQLELYQLQDGRLVEVGRSSLAQPNILTSSVLPVSFRLLPGSTRPRIAVVHTADGHSWQV